VKRLLVPPAEGAVARGRKPTFSAVIAAFQAAAYIGDAIDSLLAQTLEPHEIIICDDGSTDDLVGALRPYRDHVILIRKENGGEASAKNAAARSATGDFLAIIDADDVYLPERLEALTELSAERPDLDLLTTDCFMVVNGRVVRRGYHPGYRFETDNQRRAILQRNFLVGGITAVRRERFLQIGGFDESLRWATDWDCWIRLILTGSSAGMVAAPLAEYRIRPTGLASNRLRMFEGRLAVLQKTTLRRDLSDTERWVLTEAVKAQRRDLAAARARVALTERHRGARRLALSLALTSGVRPDARVRAVLAAALPRAAGRHLVARQGGLIELAGGITVPAGTDPSRPAGKTVPPG
jgi:glycosyl transferase family 2